MSRYETILDLYPILSTFPHEASILAMRLEQEVLSYLDNKDNRLLFYLSLAKDLGYIDERVFLFLEKKVN